MTSQSDNLGPNFILAGAAKSGTTALARYLADHPEVFLSKPKEPNLLRIPTQLCA